MPRAGWLGCAAALALAWAPCSGAAEAALDLTGSWHVLVHYRDAASGKPDQLRWEDRVWKFERAGDRLRWTDYPIVVFSDDSGRFERLGSNRQSRVLGAWEPDASQLAQIRSGLSVNPRGAKTKLLSSSDGKAWTSGEVARPASSSFLTYTETWSITGLPGQPVFSRLDTLGGARAEGLEGLTRYTTLTVEEGGQLLRGRFERDGTRSGTFVVRRSGEVSDVVGKGQRQFLEDALRERLEELEDGPPEP